MLILRNKKEKSSLKIDYLFCHSDCFLTPKTTLTNDKNRFHYYIGDDCLVEERRLPCVPESCTIRNYDGDVECADEN